MRSGSHVSSPHNRTKQQYAKHCDDAAAHCSSKGAPEAGQGAYEGTPGGLETPQVTVWAWPRVSCTISHTRSLTVRNTSAARRHVSLDNHIFF